MVVPAERDSARAGTHEHQIDVSTNRPFYLYILASRRHGTLYIGVTCDLIRRVYEHRIKAVPGFTKKYSVDRLVYFEIFDDPVAAITREKQVKKWRRDWKIALIEAENPDWRDLFEGIAQWAWLRVHGSRLSLARLARPGRRLLLRPRLD